MWILMVEAFVALFLLVFIVWWTMPGKKKAPPAKRPDQPEKQADDGR